MEKNVIQVEPEDVTAILKELDKNFGCFGFEFQPFKIGWYNSFVQPIFKLDYDDDTIAFLIVSSPVMFENAFIPFLKQKAEDLFGLRDPIDECMMYYFSKIPQLYPKYSLNIVHDFQIHPNRRPKIVMQTAAHASGAAYLYHPSSILPSNGNKKMFGVCIHPKYGGWFALRAVAIFENLQCADLIRTPPVNVIPSKTDQIKLLEQFNNNWTDWKYRDIIKVFQKYSELQKKYFATPPGNRKEVIKEILFQKKTIDMSSFYIFNPHTLYLDLINLCFAAIHDLVILFDFKSKFRSVLFRKISEC